jgi:hypothetical protein
MNEQRQKLLIPLTLVRMLEKRMINATEAIVLALIHEASYDRKTDILNEELGNRIGRTSRQAREILNELVRKELIDTDQFLPNRRFLILREGLGFPNKPAPEGHDPVTPLSSKVAKKKRKINLTKWKEWELPNTDDGSEYKEHRKVARRGAGLKTTKGMRFKHEKRRANSNNRKG